MTAAVIGTICGYRTGDVLLRLSPNSDKSSCDFSTKTDTGQPQNEAAGMAWEALINSTSNFSKSHGVFIFIPHKLLIN